MTVSNSSTVNLSHSMSEKYKHTDLIFALLKKYLEQMEFVDNVGAALPSFLNL